MADVIIADPEIEALLQQQQEISNQIAEKKQQKKDSVIKQIAEAMTTFNITVKELNSALPKELKVKTRKSAVINPKYYNPEDRNQTWTGRGIAPSWAKALKEQNRLEEFRV